MTMWICWPLDCTGTSWLHLVRKAMCSSMFLCLTLYSCMVFKRQVWPSTFGSRCPVCLGCLCGGLVFSGGKRPLQFHLPSHAAPPQGLPLPLRCHPPPHPCWNHRVGERPPGSETHAFSQSHWECCSMGAGFHFTESFLHDDDDDICFICKQGCRHRVGLKTEVYTTQLARSQFSWPALYSVGRAPCFYEKEGG